jgi:hypothetical protein
MMMEYMLMNYWLMLGKTNCVYELPVFCSYFKWYYNYKLYIEKCLMFFKPVLFKIVVNVIVPCLVTMLVS